MFRTRALLGLFVFALLCTGVSHSATTPCSSKPHAIHSGAILATMSYWARPGKTGELYNALAAENSLLARHGLRRYQLYRSSAGDGPQIVWAIEFPNFKAHDAWLDAAEKIHESPSEMAADRRADADSARMVHSHYLLHDGWSVNPCP